MKRVHFLVEGPTEKEFVDNVLRPHLFSCGKLCDARLLTTSRDWSEGRFYKGGMISYGKLKHQLILAVKEDHAADSFFTTMLDYYGLPAGFPGLQTTTTRNTGNPKVIVGNAESALLNEMIHAFPSLPIASKFVPNIMCHEFETLLLSDCSKIAKYYIECQANIQTLANQVSQVGDPELVNSSPNTAPSKRIISAIPEYDKVTAGAIIAMDVGLSVLRQRCMRFNNWLSRLEAL